MALNDEIVFEESEFEQKLNLITEKNFTSSIDFLLKQPRFDEEFYLFVANKAKKAETLSKNTDLFQYGFGEIISIKGQPLFKVHGLGSKTLEEVAIESTKFNNPSLYLTTIRSRAIGYQPVPQEDVTAASEYQVSEVPLVEIKPEPPAKPAASAVTSTSEIRTNYRDFVKEHLDATGKEGCKYLALLDRDGLAELESIIKLKIAYRIDFPLNKADPYVYIIEYTNETDLSGKENSIKTQVKNSGGNFGGTLRSYWKVENRKASQTVGGK